MTPKTIRIILLSFLFTAAATAVHSASLVQGRIYLKDGRVIECEEKDRLKIPKHKKDVKLFRRAYYKDKSKEVYAYGDIDSIVCRHPASPQHTRTFIPSEPAGWLWQYFRTPEICAGVYSHKGYGVDDNGGIEVWVKHRYFSRSRTAYYLCKRGEAEFYVAGSASRKANDSFRERVAEYISDDQTLAETILSSNEDRSGTILLLRYYIPSRH